MSLINFFTYRQAPVLLSFFFLTTEQNIAMHEKQFLEFSYAATVAYVLNIIKFLPKLLWETI